jgi:two-component system, NtrC family, response regulator PilR
VPPATPPPAPEVSAPMLSGRRAGEAAPAVPPDPIPEAPSATPVAANLQSVERAMIERALQNAKFNKSKAATALGLTRHQLYIRMRRHGFD